MTRLEALEELTAKVEAGDWFPGLAQLSIGGVQNYHNACLAFGGSLDAAKELHEAVLPYGWCHETFSLNGEVVLKRSKPVDRTYGFADMDPARAWLLAILKALIAMEERE